MTAPAAFVNFWPSSTPLREEVEVGAVAVRALSRNLGVGHHPIAANDCLREERLYEADEVRDSEEYANSIQHSDLRSLTSEQYIGDSK